MVEVVHVNDDHLDIVCGRNFSLESNKGICTSTSPCVTRCSLAPAALEAKNKGGVAVAVAVASAQALSGVSGRAECVNRCKAAACVSRAAVVRASSDFVV